MWNETEPMVPTKATLFQLLSARMRWLGQRQAVIGQNIANADTPDYRPQDLREGSFERMVQRVADASAGGSLAPRRTHAAHLGAAAGAGMNAVARDQETTYEVAPDGNAVVLEEQMGKMAGTALDHQLSSNLYRKYVSMVRTALGTPGG